MGKKLLILTSCVLLLLSWCAIVSAAGGGGLLTVSDTSPEPGGSVAFSLDLTAIPETCTSYTAAVTVSPSVSALTCTETGSSGGSVTLTSAEVGTLALAHFTMALPADAGDGTAYSVTVVVTGDTGETLTDSFSVTVKAPVSTETEPENTPAAEETPVVGGGSQGTFSSGSAAMAGTASSGQSAAVTYPGSANNYLSSLAVTGYDFQEDFNKVNDTYFLTVAGDVETISVLAEAEDDAAVVAFTGGEELQVGLNKVMVCVTAENGEVRTYRIYVTREEAQ